MKSFIIVIFLIIAIGVAIFFYVRYFHTVKKINEILDDLLSEKEIKYSSLEDGEISAIAYKAKRIQKKLELEVEKVTEEKDAVKSLISNMAHQLKTPLANVMLYQELLTEDSLHPDKRKNFQGKLKSQTVKIDWILQSLFKMMRLESGAITFEADKLPIKNTIGKAVNDVYDKAQRKGIEIRVEAIPDICLWHNEKWTAEALVNIIENAVKYSKEDTTIVISLECMEMYSKINVKDQGMGVDKSEFTLIFKRFYRSQQVEEIEGSGIGLYLTRIILEREKGYITITSERGKGSCFSVFLQNC